VNKRPASAPLDPPVTAGGRRHARRYLVAVLSNIRRKLGFLKEDGDDLEDLDVGQDNDEQSWVPYREVQHHWRRRDQGHMAYQLWMLKLGVDPEECDYDDAWIWAEVDLGGE
jgi:hypothetical protein